MANDVLAQLVELMADLGHEVATTLHDPQARDELLGQAGLPAPPGAPPASQDAANLLDTLHTKAHAGAQTGEADSLELLVELSQAMVVLVSLVEEAVAMDVESPDDWVNVTATLLDAVALTRLRLKSPPTVALLQAAHLISDDRLLIADLFRAHDEWGSFVLGHPADDDAKADSWSILLGAALTALGKIVPYEDSKGREWAVDMLFGWDPEPAPAHPHAVHVLQRMATIVLTHRDDGGAVEEHAGLTAVVVPPADGGWGMFFALDVGGGLTFPIGAHLELLLEADLPNAIDSFTGSDIVPGFTEVSGTGSKAKVSFRRQQEAADHWVIGNDESVHLEIGTFLLGMELGDPTRFHLAVGDGELDMPKEKMGFLGALLPSDGAKLAFDVDLVVDTNGNVTFAGGAGMTVTTPVNVSIPGLDIRSVTVALAIEDAEKGVGATLAATVAFGLNLGKPFRVSVDRMGAKLVWTLPTSPNETNGAPVVRGNLGPYGDVDIEFVAPRGIGVAINIGPVKGGGFLFFDPPHRTYGGVLEAGLDLCRKGIQIKAAGLLRETDDGWSFVVIVSAQFEPGIEIFLGLTLNGVGGMVGINVAVDVVKLRAGLHDGSVGRLLFPDDPVGNAPAIIETMTAVFPPRPGGWVAGPMFQLGWGRPNSFVSLSVAVVLVFPSPALLAILGRVRVGVPEPDFAIVDIKADFLGVISFEEPSVSFDASLVDSRVAAFPLTGDMAMRAGQPGFILSVGGFNPRFTPPASMPKLRRVAIDISANPITKIRAEAYLAVTSNTFQAGLHASLDIDAGAASIHGWLDFDTLIQWDPVVHFTIHMDIGLELRVGGESIAGVSVDLLLEGPGPWHAKGDASISFFFFSIHVGFEVTWGELAAADPQVEVDVSLLTAQALSAPGAWCAIAPDTDAVVTFRTVERTETGVHPYGQLSARQQAVPIGVPVARVGRSKVTAGSATVVLTPIAGAPASAPTTGLFAASQFQDLSDDEKLSRPSFEPFQDGVAFGAAQTATSAEQVSTASYETVFIPEEQRSTGPLHLGLLVHALEVGAIARSGLHRAEFLDGPDQRVRLFDETYRVVAADTLTATGAAPGTFTSATAAYTAASAAGGPLLVVGAHEVVS
jgi:hypothetical protein